MKWELFILHDVKYEKKIIIMTPFIVKLTIK